VLRLLQLFIDISLFRSNPQDLPKSRFLLGIAIAASVITSFPLLLTRMHEVNLVVVAIVINLFLVLIILRGGLYLMELEQRFMQAATALFGTDAILNLPAMMLDMLLLGEEISGISALGVILNVMLLIWGLAVVGHILRHTLSIRFAAGVVVAVVYAMLMQMLIQQILPATI
jgi:hypothetical protein